MSEPKQFTNQEWQKMNAIWEGIKFNRVVSDMRLAMFYIEGVTGIKSVPLGPHPTVGK